MVEGKYVVMKVSKTRASSISVGSYSIPYGLDYEEIYQILKLGPQ